MGQADGPGHHKTPMALLFAIEADFLLVPRRHGELGINNLQDYSLVV
jgi:hypothetical protein